MNSNTAHPTARQLPLAELVIDERLQSRVESHKDFINELAELYRAGTNDIPPIEVFEVDGKLHIVDGFHRYAAAVKAERGWLLGSVAGKGSFDDAVWCALSKNHTHGVRRTRADKRRAVELAIENGFLGDLGSNREVAKHLGVSEGLVRKVLVERTECGEGAYIRTSDESEPVKTDDDDPETVTAKDGGKRLIRKVVHKRRTPKPELSAEDNSPRTVIDVDVEELVASDDPVPEAEETLENRLSPDAFANDLIEANPRDWCLAVAEAIDVQLSIETGER